MRYAHSLGSMSSAKMDGKLKKPLDYINIVLQIVEHILSWSNPESEATIKMPYLVIESTKKNRRAFIIKSDQIVSFSFPFHIYKEIGCVTTLGKWHVRYKDIDVSTAKNLIIALKNGIERPGFFFKHKLRKAKREIADKVTINNRILETIFW